VPYLHSWFSRNSGHHDDRADENSNCPRPSLTVRAQADTPRCVFQLSQSGLIQRDI
jgi:hypothetical protein